VEEIRIEGLGFGLGEAGRMSLYLLLGAS